MKELVKEKERFFSSAYHDIQQPLAAINLFIRSARIKLEGEHAASHDLDVIEETARDILDMFKDIQDYSELGSYVPHLAPVDTQAVLTEVFEQYLEPAKSRGIEFRISVRRRRRRPSKVTAPCSSGHCPILYRMRSRTPPREVLSSAGWRLENGFASTYGTQASAFRPMHRDAIFAEYYQINNPGRDRSKGLGLGLSIVHRVAWHSAEAQHAFLVGRRARVALFPVRTDIRNDTCRRDGRSEETTHARRSLRANTSCFATTNRPFSRACAACSSVPAHWWIPPGRWRDSKRFGRGRSRARCHRHGYSPARWADGHGGRRTDQAAFRLGGCASGCVHHGRTGVTSRTSRFHRTVRAAAEVFRAGKHAC